MTSSTKTTWRLEESDAIQDVIDLCALWWEDTKFFETYKVPYAPDKERFKTLYQVGALNILCGRQDGKLIAVYAATITPYHFNPAYTIASEIVWCIHPDHKHSGLLIELMSEIKRVWIHYKVDIASLAVQDKEEYKPVGSYLEAAGFTHMDNMFFTRGVKNV